MKKIINVIQDDIDYGGRGRSDSCPVARAIKRATKAEHVYVGQEIYINGKWYKYPISVLDFIAYFDRNENVTPFKFELDI